MFMHQEKMATKEWVINVDNQLRKTVVDAKSKWDEQRWRRRSIYKLPACVTNLNKNAYMPQVISFGPYHRGNDNFKPMEEHKDRALLQFLMRSGKTLQSCFEFLNEVAEELKDAYDPLDMDLQRDTDAFLKIMIRDGCFMLEIFRASKGNFEGYAKNDPVFSEHGKLYVIPHIRRDMLMLENQLPMKVLYMLHQFERPYPTEDEYSTIVQGAWESTMKRNNEESTNLLVYEFLFAGRGAEAPPDCLHILHMQRKILLGCSTENDQPKDSMPKGGGDIIRSAIELHEAGITIKKSKSNCIKDIKFEGGVLSLPMIVVDDTTEPLYLNLMAFERFHVGAGNEVTAYVFFMDNIIDDARDISLMHSKDIIQNGIGSDKAAAKLFNSLSKDVTLDGNSELGAVYKKVNGYCKNRWPRDRAYLIHTYFTSPWALLSLLAAVFLFALTITQTVYSIKDFYKPQ